MSRQDLMRADSNSSGKSSLEALPLETSGIVHCFDS